MRRTNTFDVVPMSDADEELLFRLLDASAALWNEINYERRQRYADPDSDIWDLSNYGERYAGVLGAATVQQIERQNAMAWRSYFALRKKGEAPSKPGFWGNREDGRELLTTIRTDSYTIEWGDRSRLDVLVGQELKSEYGLDRRDRFRLEIRGAPRWTDYNKQGRLVLEYDEVKARFRAYQSVTVDETYLDTPMGDESAALDIGANTLVACTTTTGQRYLYGGRALFERYRATTEEIGRLQSLLADDQHSSKRIRRLYRRRTRQRDHAQRTLIRDLVERLYEQGVAKIYVGDLTDILEAHWSVEVNTKTHSFWAFRTFTDRLSCAAEEYGIEIEERSEAWTSQICPACGSTERTMRHEDTITCTCGFEGHADLSASESFLKQQTDITRPMARPVRLTWDNHEWRPITPAPPLRQTNPNEERTNWSTCEGNATSGGSNTVNPRARGSHD